MQTSESPLKNSQAAPKEKYLVFVSYASEDTVACRKIMSHLLKDARIKPWAFYAPGNIPAGKKWAQILERKIKEADLFLLLFSRSANKSDWVEREVDSVVARNAEIRKVGETTLDGSAKGSIPLLVFHLDNSKMNDALNFILRNTQHVNAGQGDWEDDLDKLGADVAECLGLLAETVPVPWHSRFRDFSRTIRNAVVGRTMGLVVLLASILALALGLLLWHYLGPDSHHPIATIVEANKATSQESLMGDPVSLSVTVEPKAEHPRGKVKFKWHQEVLDSVDLNDQGEATSEIRPDWGIGEFTIEVDFEPAEPTRFSGSSSKLVHKRNAPPRDPDRYGVIEISGEKVRALVAKVQKHGSAWKCDWPNKIEDQQMRRKSFANNLRVDSRTGLFLNETVTTVEDRVKDLHKWLANDWKVEPGNIKVLLGSGSQVNGLNHHCVDKLKDQLGTDVEEVQPWEEVACLAVRIIPENSPKRFVVIDIGNDNTKCVAVERIPTKPFPERRDGSSGHYSGARSLILETENNGQKEDAGKFVYWLQVTAKEVAKREFPNNIFQPVDQEDVIMVGENAWSLVDEDFLDGKGAWSPRKSAILPQGQIDKLENKVATQVLNGSFTHFTKKQLATAEILKSINGYCGLGNHHSVTFVDTSGDDWLLTYLERLADKKR